MQAPVNGSLTNTQKNISAVSAMEHEALASRSNSQRLGDLIARSAGQMWFIVAHAVWFGGWMAVNCGLLPGCEHSIHFRFSF